MPNREQVGATALVVAAGVGARAGFDVPKQFALLAGRSLLGHTLDALSRSSDIGRILVVIDENERPRYDAAVRNVSKLASPVFGGATRQDSVLNGLRALAADHPPLVMIHDAARPFVTQDLIERLVGAARRSGAAVPVLPIVDTIKRLDGDRSIATVERNGLAVVQTPQVFSLDTILRAHEDAADSGITGLTDDAAALERLGIAVTAVEGDLGNVKLTTAADFQRAEARLQPNVEVRVGQGFDVHAFAEGGDLVLCGVPLPFEKGLVGHSDADVALHALTDAILGALAEGDIGAHFPPTDPTWKDARSNRFLEDAVRRIDARKGRLVHCDLTLICEAPKITPHRDAMRRRVAEICGISPERVSIKATTSERLGFTGRGEGIAAMACATVELARRNDERR